MKFNRFNDKVQQGIDSELLLNNPVFFTAVERLLNRYAEIEEKLVLEEKGDVREATARIRQYAMMRRAVLDVVNELNDITFEGKIQESDKTE